MVFALLGYGLLHPPPLKNYKLEERLTVRTLELQLPEPEKQRAAGGSAQHSLFPNAKSSAEGAKPGAQLAVVRQTEDAPVSHTTLLQPKLKNLTKLKQDMPLPTVVLWSPEQSPVRMIIPPPPVKLAPALTLASPQLPNREERLADVRISSTDLSTAKIPILPSTTTPVVVKGPDAPQAVPTTSSTSSQQPTPASVVALSDMRMPEGKVILPPAESSTASSAPGALTQGKSDSSAHADSSSPAGSDGAAAEGTGKGDAKGATVAAGAAGKGVGARIWPAPGNGNGADTRSASGSDDGNGEGNQPTATRIVLPRNGVFGSVVVGVSLVDKYPETATLWGGRMAYTVYLHVGQAKSWILQYSLSRADEAANAGNIARIEAPWPYNIVRPNIPSSILNADALILHGFVNADGHFEELKVVFPDDFPQSKFVLDALAQWQFRAAVQSGQTRRVEVLLIIPDMQ